MNISELQEKLNTLGIDESSYCIGSGVEDEQYCIEIIEEKWHYYYSERGQRTGEITFNNENEAYEYLYELLMKDPSVKA